CRVLAQAGICTGTGRAVFEQAGFYVCNRDLEEELVRAFGMTEVIQLIESGGDKRAFELFCAQPNQKTKPREEQLHDFLATKGRKVRYAPVMVEKMDMANLPPPLKGVLASV